jgi:hypothetical protein
MSSDTPIIIRFAQVSLDAVLVQSRRLILCWEHFTRKVPSVHPILSAISAALTL